MRRSDPPLASLPRGNLLRLLALCLFFFALWCLLGRYWGLQHDAQLYVLQALGRLQPGIYGKDLYLRYAGNAELTLFPVVSSFFVATFGAAKGAALATILMHVLWFGAAWLLIRSMMNRKLALLAFGLIVAIPTWYGSGRVFRLVEPFFSARPLAEALSLVALALLVSRRRGPAIVFAALAMCVHPLMAFPIVLVMLLVSWSPGRPARASLAAFLALVVGSIAASLLLAWGEPLMSGQWLELTRLRSRYLFTEAWATGDWQTSVLPLTTLALAAIALPVGKAATLSRAALVVGAAGLVLTIISGGPLPLKLVLQGQPWRWVWIGGFLALVLLPLLVRNLWRSGRAGRAATLFFVAGWMLSSWSSSDQIPPVGAGALIAVLALGLWLARNRASTRISGMLISGGWALLALIGVAATASAFAVGRGSFHYGTDPRWVELTAEMLKMFPPIAACAVLAAWYFTVGRNRGIGGAWVALVSLALLTGAAPGAKASWTTELLSAGDKSRFVAWRETIPADAEVLWPDIPQGTWFLLERRNFLSRSQLAGIVFSEELANEARRRSIELSEFADPDEWFGKECRAGAGCRSAGPNEACAAADLDFLVLETEAAGFAEEVEWPGPGHRVYLYDCAEFAVSPAR